MQINTKCLTSQTFWTFSSLSVQISYTIITTYEIVAIKCLDDLVLTGLMDLVGYKEVK